MVNLSISRPSLIPDDFEFPSLDGAIDPDDVNAMGDGLLALAAYCKAKSRAMRWRLAGRIGEALEMEDRAESIYEGLPEWARW